MKFDVVLALIYAFNAGVCTALCVFAWYAGERFYRNCYGLITLAYVLASVLQGWAV